MKANVNVDAIIKSIEGVCQDTIQQVDRIIDDVGKMAVEKVKDLSPVDTSEYAQAHTISRGKNKGNTAGTSGLYKKGWKVKKNTGRHTYGVTILNKTQPQLTHLLEYGHIGRDGKFVQPKPHIENAEEWAREEIERRVNAL